MTFKIRPKTAKIKTVVLKRKISEKKETMAISVPKPKDEKP